MFLKNKTTIDPIHETQVRTGYSYKPLNSPPLSCTSQYLFNNVGTHSAVENKRFCHHNRFGQTSITSKKQEKHNHVVFHKSAPS